MRDTLRAFSMASAVFTGTVDFSTTILLLLATLAIMRAAPSQYVRSAALPAPTPRVFVGVFTLQGVTRIPAQCRLTPHSVVGVLTTLRTVVVVSSMPKRNTICQVTEGRSPGTGAQLLRDRAAIGTQDALEPSLCGTSAAVKESRSRCGRK